MAETHFTPGDWDLDPEGLFCDGITAVVRGADGIGIVDIFPTKLNSGSNRWSREQQANARLIAAAPDLLKALLDLLELTESNAPDGYYTEHPSINQARHSIAKALGERATANEQK